MPEDVDWRTKSLTLLAQKTNDWKPQDFLRMAENHLNGREGLERSAVRAVEWFERAAQEAFRAGLERESNASICFSARYSLGQIYRHGTQGVPQNLGHAYDNLVTAIDVATTEDQKRQARNLMAGISRTLSTGQDQDSGNLAARIDRHLSL